MLKCNARHPHNHLEQMMVIVISQHLGPVTSWSSLSPGRNPAFLSRLSLGPLPSSLLVFHFSAASLLSSPYQHSLSCDSSCGVRALWLPEFFPHVNSSSGRPANTSLVVPLAQRLPEAHHRALEMLVCVCVCGNCFSMTNKKEGKK